MKIKKKADGIKEQRDKLRVFSHRIRSQENHSTF